MSSCRLLSSMPIVCCLDYSRKMRRVFVDICFLVCTYFAELKKKKKKQTLRTKKEKKTSSLFSEN